MLHNFYHMLGALVSACVMVLGRLLLMLLLLAILSHVPLPSLLLRARPHFIAGIKLSACAPCCCLCLLDCYPLLPQLLLELTWMLPGSLLRYHDKFKAAMLNSVDVSAVAVRSHSFVSVGNRFRPKACWSRMLAHAVLYLTLYIYELTEPFVRLETAIHCWKTKPYSWVVRYIADSMTAWPNNLPWSNDIPFISYTVAPKKAQKRLTYHYFRGKMLFHLFGCY